MSAVEVDHRGEQMRIYLPNLDETQKLLMTNWHVRKHVLNPNEAWHVIPRFERPLEPVLDWAESFYHKDPPCDAKMTDEHALCPTCPKGPGQKSTCIEHLKRLRSLYLEQVAEAILYGVAVPLHVHADGRTRKTTRGVVQWDEMCFLDRMGVIVLTKRHPGYHDWVFTTARRQEARKQACVPSSDGPYLSRAAKWVQSIYLPLSARFCTAVKFKLAALANSCDVRLGP